MTMKRVIFFVSLSVLWVTQAALLPEQALAREPDVHGLAAFAADLITTAGATPDSQRDKIRKRIAQVAGDKALADELCRQATVALESDHVRALLALALIGEMKNEAGTRCLLSFVRMPYPEVGDCVGEDPDEPCAEIQAHLALASLQMQAVDGLAFLGNAGGDAEICRIAGEHPKQEVRSEAVTAFLWNRGFSSDARNTILACVQPNDRILVDRIIKEPGETVDSFDKKITDFLAAHPEAVPPIPACEEGVDCPLPVDTLCAPENASCLKLCEPGQVFVHGVCKEAIKRGSPSRHEDRAIREFPNRRGP
jgi:hypothetical protein